MKVGRYGQEGCGEGGCGQPRPPLPAVGYPPVRGPQQPEVGGDARLPEVRLPEAVDVALADDLDTPAALAATDELAERGDGPGVAATAAVLGVVLAPVGG